MIEHRTIQEQASGGRELQLKVIGIGCSKSRALMRNVENALRSNRLPVSVAEVKEVDDIMNYNIDGTPALLINDQVVFQKEVPSVAQIKHILQESYTNRIPMLRTILVPTDFSETARNAYLAAYKLAQKTGARIKVIHCYTGDYDPNQVFVMQNSKEYYDRIQRRLKQFVQPAPNHLPNGMNSHRVETEACLGFAVDEITRISQLKEVDMIVMGTTGEHDVLEKVFGSVSTGVSQKATCPVLLIPKNSSKQQFNKIVYATDLPATKEYTLRRMLEFAQIFEAEVHFVHINNATRSELDITEQLLRELAKREDLPNFKIVTVNSNSVEEGLNKYAKENEIDLVVLANRQRNFWKKLVDRSLTRRMALTTQIPLMVLHLEE